MWEDISKGVPLVKDLRLQICGACIERRMSEQGGEILDPGTF